MLRDKEELSDKAEEGGLMGLHRNFVLHEWKPETVCTIYTQSLKDWHDLYSGSDRLLLDIVEETAWKEKSSVYHTVKKREPIALCKKKKKRGVTGLGQWAKKMTFANGLKDSDSVVKCSYAHNL